jgi:hypothetical protein
LEDLKREISSDFPEEWIQQCLKILTKSQITEQIKTNPTVISLNCEFIAVLKAHRILQKKTVHTFLQVFHCFPLLFYPLMMNFFLEIHRVEDFLKQWHDALPEEISSITENKSCLNLLKVSF